MMVFEDDGLAHPRLCAQQDQKEPPPKPRKFKYAPKVRTGCKTCKIRRVKCDETKPHCNRCTQTGRKCDGYQPLLIVRQPVVAVQRRTKPQLHTFQSNDSFSNIHFQFYCEVTSQTIRQHLDYLATTLTGTRFQQNAETLRSCRSELFTQVIPQASQSRQEIRHIISAIAALRRKLEFGDQPGQSGLETVFLRHQSKAIHLLGLSKDAYALEIILVACPLLAFCEFLQGNIETGISHLKSGLRILQTAQQNPFVRSPMGQLIKEYLRPLLAGIVVERAVNGSLSLHFNELLRNDSSSELIRSLTPSVPLEQVWIRLASIAQRLDRIVNGFTSPTDADSITQVRRDLDDWRDGVENFQLSTEELDTRSKKILRFSRAYKVVVDALVHAFVEGSEISFDRWSSNLCAALWQLCVFVRAQDNSALSNRAVALTGQTDITSTFWLVPPLFQCATRCRVPDVRRRALLLLRDLNRVEGPWNSSIAADIAASIIDIEERGLGEVESCSDIPNTSRVRLQIACRFPDQDGLVSLLFKPFPHKTTTPNILEECEVTDTKWISQVQWPLDNVLRNISYEPFPTIEAKGEDGMV